MAEKENVNKQPAAAESSGEAKKSEIALREEKILEFWRANKIFEKSVEQREGQKEFIFYEGPPTANAKPALHHLEARSFKDAVPRYKTMRGYHVRRKGGWDTHGLPVELQVEKKLGLNSKKAIEEYGIAKFNRECRDSVWEHVGEWTKFTERIGFWVDQENPYVTYHNSYIESVWNIVQKINEKKLLYKDYKVVPWCPRCGTALSSHELAQGYEDVKDLSVYVKFKITNQKKYNLPENTYILAWTTTPWTLPGNVALAVGEDIKYNLIKSDDGSEFYIVAEELNGLIHGSSNPNVVVIDKQLKGSQLVGLEYEPLFPYLAETIPESEKPKLANAFKVYAADFVNTEDGTGIVHTAVMYGQDDFELGTKVGLPKHHLVNPEGKFIKGAGFLQGRFVKEKDEKGKPTLDVDIIKYLTDKNLFFKKENYEHSYPHCWRCHTALIYYARDSWYIRMSDPQIKKELISQNQEINWEPAYTRDGRFGEWLREIKDWAISRERYWGTPLPIWQCVSCKKFEVVGSIADLKEKTKKSGNKYFVMRHGEAENNIEGSVHYKDVNHNAKLTEKGKAQVLESSKNFKEKIDLVFSSPFNRSEETARIASGQIGFSFDKIIYDKRIEELEPSSIFEGKERAIFKKYYDEEYLRNPDKILPDGESFKDVIKRVGDFIYELETKYSDKNILIFSHEGASDALSFVTKGLTLSDLSGVDSPFISLQNAEIRKFDFIPLPHNENYELDLHKPYIDELPLVCNCGNNLARTKEVMDVWFDSGAMPFAQDHYPFENKKWIEGSGYPADFISEAIDQTRGWFYTLHAIGILMGRGKAYKNVICLGHLLDANGKKMSKSVGNIVDPWMAMDKHGVDALRLWMYSVNQPGESKNFDEKTVTLIEQQVFGLLYNVLAFYELYRDPKLEILEYKKSNNILDRWILARLSELIKLSTENMDNYKLLEPVRAVKEFVGDLSTWYLRRSRERIKEGAANPELEQAQYGARQTLYFVLKTLSKLLAPFAPFAAEDIWLKLKNEQDIESVHLTQWPSMSRSNLDKEKEILKDMRIARDICTVGNAERQKSGIPVRQPLNELRIKNYELKIEYTELIKEELNVKKVKQNKNIEAEIEFDANITPALKAEGEHREFMRELQDERKKLGLNPGDKMILSIEKIYKKYKIMPSLQAHMLRVAAVASVICDNFTEPLNKNEIIIACLLHDMGNIIKSDLKYFPQFNEPEGIEYWQKVKDEFIEKYGKNEHHANLKIIKELGLSEKIVSNAEQNFDFLLSCEYCNENNFVSKILNYADWRVDPYGIVSYNERMNEAKKRYQNRADHNLAEEEREKLVACGREIEKQIFAKCKIKPEDINDKTAEPIIAELKNLMIK